MTTETIKSGAGINEVSNDNFVHVDNVIEIVGALQNLVNTLRGDLSRCHAEKVRLAQLVGELREGR